MASLGTQPAAGHSIQESMETFCTNVSHKRKLEGFGLYDAHKDCKYVKLEAQRVATYTYFCHLWQVWLSQNLVEQDASKFQRSGVPSSIMYVDGEQWKLYPSDITSALIVCFSTGKSAAKFSADGKVYLVDFVHMLQFNAQTGSMRSIAWLDQRGELFTPSKRIQCRIEDFFSTPPNPSDGVPICHTSSCMPPHVHDFAQLGDKLTKLAEDDQEFTHVKEKFFSGLPLLSKYASVTGVYKSCHSGTLGHVRLQTFKGQEEAIVEARGDANVCWAWHGTSKKGIEGIIQHGFGQPRAPKNGVVFGVGVYLAPEDCSHISAFYSDVDENGEQHMLLCKVIMGRSEKVHPGSEQFHPSNVEYDTGVDDVDNPKRYIIWSTHMNTHILPQFVVSFKLEPSLRDLMRLGQRQKSFWRNSVPVWRHPGRKGLGGRKETCSSRKVEAVCIASADKVEAACIESTDRDHAVVSTSGMPAQTWNATSCTSSQSESCNSAVADLHKPPQSPWISFTELLSMVESRLDSNALSTLQELYSEFQIGKLPRVLLVKMIRCVVGDAILRECIDGKAAMARRSCGTEALCMEKDGESAFATQRYT